MNASLAGIIHECIETKQYEHVYGMINGVMGLLESRYIDLLELFSEQEALNQLKHSPAMYLGSCRYKLPDVQDDPQTYERLFHTFEQLQITDFYYIGGNDSMDTVAKLSSYARSISSSIRFIGIPKTIDNDLMGTDHTPGFGSAAKYVATSMLEIAYDSSIYKLNAVTIVEIMGRNAGWLTAASALARTQCNEAPDLIYLPEVPFSTEKFLEDIRQVFRHKKNIIIAVSEGIKNENGDYLDSDSKYTKRDAFGHILHSGTGKVLETLVYQEFKCKVRSIELNVLQRCAMHIASKVDLDESFQIGQAAVQAALSNHTGVMMTFKRKQNYPYQIECTYKDVSEIANLEQRIPVEWINKDHNDITQELYDYLIPLIQGEVTIQYENGIPCYSNISHLRYK
ncbi:6-phosphofructokinase [Allocoprobacillus halotolerans]|uniref:Pyrophosphate--fructose 6-phosphate 1-phosphotransferase n=1 Tax=Allocoprobacillus halotolerans TaxID=2944914 RepID=A0ABY5I6A5_9FIRM|nr:6-phosphofructokinase [Allocoprobacillus halotolerans]